jgi:CO/xanthine dehydrogenase FAD-binding subunit
VDIERPTALHEAVAGLAAQPGATLLAGGTDVMVEVNYRTRRPHHVIALRRVEELKTWDERRIGAGVTFRRLENGPIRALAQLARTVGSPQIRAAGTIGGNLGTASPAGDSHPFLAACDAHVELQSKRGTRTVRWDEFLVGVKRNSRHEDELITAVILPDDLPQRQEFAKVGVRSAMVISTVSACVMVDDGDDVRVALGAVGPTVLRARGAEDMINNERPRSEAALAEFARLVSAEVRPITDHRSTEEYRRHAAGVLSRRLLERCLAS